MSDIQYQLYRQSVMRLADSLLIKDENMALAINAHVKEVYAQQGLTLEDDPATWKYYMNMAGEYHPLDVPMQIVSLDTMGTINFDRVALTTNRATLRAYTYDSRYYAELVNRYPDQEFLIRGILNPVNKAQAIAAPNYTILNYSRSEVEPNESDLLAKLQRWIDAHVARWYNPDFSLTDELYGSAFMSSIVANLPAAIMTIRNENIGSYRAHSFHIWNHLDSHGRLSKYRDFLTIKQKLWLYRNIKWVFANAGKEYTFEKLMDIILTHRGIPVAYYEHIVNNQNLETDIYAEPLMQRNPLNLLEQIAPEPTFKSVRYVMEKQTPLARDNFRFFEDNYAHWMYKLSRARLTRMITKTYESEVIDTSEQLAITLPEMLLNHWLYFSTTGRYPALITAINPYTSQTMRMTVREAFVLWLYCMNRINNLDLEFIPRLDAIYVRRSPIPTVDQLMGVVDASLVSRDLISQLVEEQVPIGVMISTEAFYDTVNSIHQTYLRHRSAFEYQQHLEARGQVNAVVDRFYTFRKCDLTDTVGETYDTYFDNRGWEFNDFARSDFELLATELFDKATGSDVRINISLRDVQRAMLGIMSQLGTYATHYIQTIDASPATVLGTLGIRVGDNDMEEREYMKVDKIGTHALRMLVQDKARVSINTGDPYYTAVVGYPISHERHSVDPTVKFEHNLAPLEVMRTLLPTVQVETDLAADLADTDWANIPDLGVQNEVYFKTVSPSIILPLTPGELSALNVTELRLHSRDPGEEGELYELGRVRYERQFAEFGSIQSGKRMLVNDVTFLLTAGDVVATVSYWSEGIYLFSVPVPTLFYPIDGVLIVDSETTYLESSDE